MPRTIDVTQFPPEVAALLLGDESPTFIERAGEPVGVLVSSEVYERWMQRRDRLFAVMDQVGARNREKTEEEVEADVQQAIREVSPAIQ